MIGAQESLLEGFSDLECGVKLDYKWVVDGAKDFHFLRCHPNIDLVSL